MTRIPDAELCERPLRVVNRDVDGQTVLVTVGRLTPARLRELRQRGREKGWTCEVVYATADHSLKRSKSPFGQKEQH